MKQKEKNIGINAILNVIKQCLSVIFPLITYPYALRILGANGIGKISYSQSIVSYFALFASFGIPIYATREGARLKGNRETFTKFSNQIFTINLLFTALAYVLLFITLILFKPLRAYSLLILLSSASMIFTTLGIEWMNNVYEDYWLVTIRSIFTHLVTLVLLFLLVRRPYDYYCYALLAVTSNAIVCISNLIYYRKYTHLRLAFDVDFKVHVKSLFIFFVNSLATSIYVNIDTTMLGWIKGDYSVGVYTVAVRVYTMIKSVLIAVYSVSISRLSNYNAEGRVHELKKIYTNLWEYLSILLIPIGIGLVSISQEVMWFMGGEALASEYLPLSILCVALIFAIFGGLTTACLNVVLRREKENLSATLISALINFTLNLFFIPWFSYNGAALTTLISELFVFLFCFVRIPHKKDYLDYKAIFISLLHAIVGSIFMFVVGIFINHFVHEYMFRMISKLLVGALVYLGILLLLKDKCCYEIILNVNKKIRR